MSLLPATFRFLPLLPLLFVFWGVLIPSSQVSAASQKRVALVIGNSAYSQAGKLKNPVNDAIDIAVKLTELGFDVTRLLNADQPEMERAIRRFIRSLSGEEAVGVFYYAGHAVEFDGSNYLIPVDAEIDVRSEVKYKTVNAGWVLDGMEEANNGLNLVILDACRNNPYHRLFRSAANGLVRMSPPQGTVLMYATQPGNVAQDGIGRNGVFTKHLLEVLEAPGLDVWEVVQQTAMRVNEETGGEQVPWVEGVVLVPFYFVPLQPRPTPQSAVPPPPPPPMIAAPKGYLQVAVNVDDVDIFVNGRKLGKASSISPLNYSQGLPVGRIEVQARAKDYESQSRQAMIKANEWTQVVFRLEPKGLGKGTLTVRSNLYGDEVFIDGKAYGSTRVDVELAAGLHEVRVEKAGYTPYEETVVLDRGSRVTVRAQLERVPSEPEPRVTKGPPAPQVSTPAPQASIPVPKKDPAFSLPIEAVITIHADSVPTGERFPSGKLKRLYTLWIQGPEGRLAEVRRVSYFFDHHTFRQKNIHSSNLSEGFKVGYVGFGCLYSVIVTLEMFDGQERKLNFNQCGALGID